MIIKKHVAESTKKAFSFISNNYNDDALIISSTKVNGQCNVYFAIDDLPKPAPTSNEVLNHTDQIIFSKKPITSKYLSNFISSEDLSDQIILDEYSNTIDLIRSTAEKILVSDTSEDTNPNIDLDCSDMPDLTGTNQISKHRESSCNTVEFGEISVLKEIKDLLKQQQEYLHKNHLIELDRIDKLNDLIVYHSSMAHESNNAITSMQAASVEAIKKMADAIVELKDPQYIHSNNNSFCIHKLKKYFLLEKPKQSPIKSLMLFSACFISLLFTLPLTESEINNEIDLRSFDNALTSVSLNTQRFNEFEGSEVNSNVTAPFRENNNINSIYSVDKSIENSRPDEYRKPSFIGNDDRTESI